MNIKKEILLYANQIGIELMGFCNIKFDDSLISFLKEKRELGLLTGFEEKDENERVNIKKVMEDAQTIISVAIPYRTCEANKDKIHISKASFGTDYHIVLKDKLFKICNFLKKKYNCKAVSSCDTTFLCEREIARKCGIGFIGKNNSLITEKYGSYVFLGEIITDIYIERSEIIENKCGNCSICIKACPSKALIKPWYIDPRRCVSFLTQKKGELTNDEINNMGLSIYGCDICQDVCPFNRCVEYSNINEFTPFQWEININPESILNLTNMEFKSTFKKTSCGWRGKKILQRNTMIALSNLKDKKK